MDNLTQAEFDSAHLQWYQETCIHSFPWTILNGPGFERIKSFGRAAIPFLLRKLQEGDDVQTWGIQWHLTELTGVDIFIGSEDAFFRRGDTYATTEAWLEWGRKNGYLGPT